MISSYVNLQEELHERIDFLHVGIKITNERKTVL